MHGSNNSRRASGEESNLSQARYLAAMFLFWTCVLVVAAAVTEWLLG